MVTGVKNELSGRTYSYLGNYRNRFKKSKPGMTAMERRLSLQFNANGKQNIFSDVNIHYLLQIIELCRQRNIDLVMLNTPLFGYYKNSIPHEYLEKYDQIVNTYQLKVVDFHELPLSDSCFIPDGDHVSGRGSVIDSPYINKIEGRRALELSDGTLQTGRHYDY